MARGRPNSAWGCPRLRHLLNRGFLALEVDLFSSVCPFFSYLPGQKQVSILDGEQVYAVNCTAQQCKRSPRVTQQSRP